MENKNQDPSIKLTRRGRLALSAGALITAGAALLSFHGHGHEAEKPEPVSTYTVQQGDTLSNVAEQVAENTPEKETMQQAAENIRDINDLPATPELVAGEQLQVPASADVDRFQQGVQLDKRTISETVPYDMTYANHGEDVPSSSSTPTTTGELPQPVVPEENGFNPNTPR